MTTVDPKKTVRVHVDPLPESNASEKLATWFKSELRKKNIQDVDL